MAMTDQDRALLVSFVICVVVLLICQLLFEYLRKKVPVVYQPRVSYPPNPLPEPANGLFAWIVPTFKISAQEVLEKRGLDVLVYLRMLESCFYAFVCMSLWSWIVLAPINGTAGNKDLPEDNSLKARGLTIVFMSNIETGSYRLIAHAVSVWLFTLLLLGLYWRDYRCYWQDRMWCFATKSRENFSVVVTGARYVTPNKPLDNIKQREQQITDKFNAMFGKGVVRRVDAVWTEPELKEKVLKYNQMIIGLEKAYFAFNKKPEERPTHKLGMLGICGEEVDSINYYTEELPKMKKEIEDQVAQPEANLSKAAVVTFHSQRVAAVAAMSIIDRHSEKWAVIPAPQADDVFWEWLDMKETMKFVRRVAVNIFMFLLIFFWSIPVMFAASLANLEKISQIDGFSWVGDIINANPTVGAFLQGFLPTLVIIIFFALLQLIVRSVSTQEAWPALSELERVVSQRMYYFQLFNIFLVYTISGTFLTQVNNLVDNLTFGGVIDLLAQSIPQQALFFSNYILVQGFISTSVLILQPGRLIVRWIFRKFLCKTKRDFEIVDKPLSFNYAGAASISFLILGIALSYSVMNPLVLSIAAFYFGYLYVVSKYLLLYVQLPMFQGRGFLFSVVRRSYVIALLIFQLLMIGVFLLYKLIGATIIIAPTPFLTLWTDYLLGDYYEKACAQGALAEIPAEEEKEKIEKTPLVDVEQQAVEEEDNDIVYFQPERRQLEDIPTESPTI